MTITEAGLNTNTPIGFVVNNTTQAKYEILQRFSTEPGDGYQWTEQDICEQCRKMIRYWDRNPDS